jgi:hypothetical protein
VALVSVESVAGAMDLDPRRVQQLAVREGMPKAGRGRYDLGKCMAWYIRYLHAKMKVRATGTEDGGLTSLKDERSRLLRLAGDLKEIELARQRREVIAIGDLEKAMSDLVVTTKARLMALPARQAADLVAEPSPAVIQGKLEKALKEALAHLATHARARVKRKPVMQQGAKLCR